MKRFFLLLVSFLSLYVLHSQIRSDNKTAATTTLPEGTISKGGKIIVLAGYKAMVSPNDSKIVVIYPISKNRTSKPTTITGTFTCNCSDNNKTNDCSVMVREKTLYCTGDACGSNCQLLVTIKPSAGLAITRETRGVEWKKFVFPTKQQ